MAGATKLVRVSWRFPAPGGSDQRVSPILPGNPQISQENVRTWPKPRSPVSICADAHGLAQGR